MKDMAMNYVNPKKQDYKIIPAYNEVSSLDFMKDPYFHRMKIGENYEMLKNAIDTYTKKGVGILDAVYVIMPYNNEGNMNTFVKMIQERLELAKKFLSRKGVIFVSVDNTELILVKNICNMIFGKQNFTMERINQDKTADDYVDFLQKFM